MLFVFVVSGRIPRKQVFRTATFHCTITHPHGDDEYPDQNGPLIVFNILSTNTQILSKAHAIAGSGLLQVLSTQYSGAPLPNTQH